MTGAEVLAPSEPLPFQLDEEGVDETLRILGAERAYLFLIDPDLRRLVPSVGRDGEGNDIAELTGYSKTLVDRVRHSGEPLVVTGSEEGAALGSHSMQAHGLRSIMIEREAPASSREQRRLAKNLRDRNLCGLVPGIRSSARMTADEHMRCFRIIKMHQQTRR